MPGRLAIDFGTSNTVAALWDAATGEGRTLPLANLTRLMLDPQGREFHAVPSLMHYHGSQVWVGQQVVEKNLLAAMPGTFRWMKTFVGSEARLPRTVGERKIDNFQAAGDFLRQILLAAGMYANLAEEDVVFTVPVEAFERYQSWLDEVVLSAGILRPRYLDEASAAALGYATKIRPGAPFMIFDLGGGTLDVSIVIRADDAPDGRPRCRSLGKAGAQVGGSAIDQWLARDAAEKAGLDPAKIRAFFPVLLQEAERVKETLTNEEAATFSATDPVTGVAVARRYGRGAFEDVLDANGLYTKVNAILDAAERDAEGHGYHKDQLQSVLMIGGSSLIPSIRRLVRGRYGERVRCERPFDAVAVGAAAYVAGAGFDDRLRHAYALQSVNRATDQYVYGTIVPAGTPYPCVIMRPDQPAEEHVHTFKAVHDEQTRFGLLLFEVAERGAAACGGRGFDLVFDQNGGARYTAREDEEDVRHRQIGEKFLISCNPPAKKGEPRFLATFSIDAKRFFCITVKDLLTGKTLHRNQPMVKLT